MDTRMYKLWIQKFSANINNYIGYGVGRGSHITLRGLVIPVAPACEPKPSREVSLAQVTVSLYKRPAPMKAYHFK